MCDFRFVVVFFSFHLFMWFFRFLSIFYICNLDYILLKRKGINGWKRKIKKKHAEQDMYYTRMLYMYNVAVPVNF